MAMTEMGEALAALSLSENVSVSAPLRQQLALALARAGALGEAGEVLRDLLVTRTPDGETLGLLGSLSKRFAESSTNPVVAQVHLQNAHDFYMTGFRQHSNPYCGINAAACAALLGDREAAAALAGEVLDVPPTGDAYWDAATRAEAFLLQGLAEPALAAYTETVALAGDRRADLAATRKQCRQLCRCLHEDAALLDAVFGIWSVAMLAGSVNGEADRSALAGATAQWLRERGVVCVWLSGQTDPLFGAEALRAGIETCVLLPVQSKKFLRDLAKSGATKVVQADWEYVLAGAQTVTELGESSELAGCDPRMLLQCLTTSAASRAAVLDTDLHGLVYENDDELVVEFWQRFGVGVDLLEADGRTLQSRAAGRVGAPSGQLDDAGEARRRRASEEFRALAQELMSQGAD
jgi:hypothetical protein